MLHLFKKKLELVVQHFCEFELDGCHFDFQSASLAAANHLYWYKVPVQCPIADPSSPVTLLCLSITVDTKNQLVTVHHDFLANESVVSMVLTHYFFHYGSRLL